MRWHCPRRPAPGDCFALGCSFRHADRVRQSLNIGNKRNIFLCLMDMVTFGEKEESQTKANIEVNDALRKVGVAPGHLLLDVPEIHQLLELPLKLGAVVGVRWPAPSGLKPSTLPRPPAPNLAYSNPKMAEIALRNIGRRAKHKVPARKSRLEIWCCGWRWRAAP